MVKEKSHNVQGSGSSRSGHTHSKKKSQEICKGNFGYNEDSSYSHLFLSLCFFFFFSKVAKYRFNFPVKPQHFIF